jgi:predicted aspartyl protease
VLALRAQAPGPIVLPVERASNVFFARATINGQGPFWFTVDTGATLTVIDPATAARAGLPVQRAGRRANVGVAAGETALSTAAGAAVEIAGLPPFSPAFLYVVPVQANAQHLRHGIDGVLGTDFLRRYVVEFDYADSRVVLKPPKAGGANRETDHGGVPISIDGNVLLAPAAIAFPDGSRTTARLLVDTGSNGALTLTSPFVRRHRLAERFQSRWVSLAVGINGTTVSPVIQLPSVAFGDAVISDANAALSQTTAGLHASEDFDGIIGAELLRRFTVTVDYPGGRMILRR